MSARTHTSGQRGFTLVEVMVAIVVLLVGVLGVVALLDGANAVTSKTKAREGATNIARSASRVSRSVRYRDLTTNELVAALSSRPGLADASPAPGYTIRQRGISYRMTLTVCSLDDPKDELEHAECRRDVPGQRQAPPGQPSRDRNPDDYKRVRDAPLDRARGRRERHPDLLDHQPRRRARPVRRRPRHDLPDVDEQRPGPDREQRRPRELRRRPRAPPRRSTGPYGTPRGRRTSARSTGPSTGTSTGRTGRSPITTAPTSSRRTPSTTRAVPPRVP